MLTIIIMLFAFSHGTTPPATAILSSDPTVVCHRGYSATVRHVTSATRRKVLLRDSLSTDSTAVVDHRIPLSLGGSNALVNLVGQPHAVSLQKDSVELYLLRAVCRSHTTTLPRAQVGMWQSWRRYQSAMRADALSRSRR